ncbi:MAG: hypothetical protein FJ288_04760 [Planctomycetes bacterium]|nr:hypothetical protein [Planctomycetota bacterium]
MPEQASSAPGLLLTSVAPSDGSTAREAAGDQARLTPRFLPGTLLAAGLCLSATTGGVRWQQSPINRLVEPSSVVGARPARASPDLGELARTALARMSPEQRALYDDILAFRDRAGEPIDINALLREIRADG